MNNTVFTCRVRSILMINCVAVALMMLGSCNNTDEKKQEKQVKQDSTAHSDTMHAEDAMADHDIAMTVSSLADAISEGETLSGADYNFEGILTDGRGMPIYTDVDGAPGEWMVKVCNDKSVEIHNVRGGDLMPLDLVRYIIDNTRISMSDRQKVQEKQPKENMTVLDLFGFDGGDISFVTSIEDDPKGAKYQRLTITIAGH